MTPDALRAAIASARLRPRMYGADARDLSGYLHGLVAGAHDGSASVAAQWQSAWDATIGSGDAPLADAEVCDVALRVVAALWPQGDDCAAYSTAPLDTPMAPAVVAAMRSAPAARVVVPDALDLDAIEARERAALAAAREALRGGYDLAGFDRLALEERRADDALRLVAALRESRAESAARLACAGFVRDEIRAAAKSADVPGGDEIATAKRMACCIRRLRAQLAAQAPAVALAAVRNGRFVAAPRVCSQCSAAWPLDRRDCPGCGHPDRAAGAVPAGFDDLFAAPPVEDDTDAAQFAALAAGERSPVWQAGEKFAERYPEAAGRILG